MGTQALHGMDAVKFGLDQGIAAGWVIEEKRVGPDGTVKTYLRGHPNGARMLAAIEKRDARVWKVMEERARASGGWTVEWSDVDRVRYLPGVTASQFKASVEKFIADGWLERVEPSPDARARGAQVLVHVWAMREHIGRVMFESMPPGKEITVTALKRLLPEVTDEQLFDFLDWVDDEGLINVRELDDAPTTTQQEN